MPEASIRRLAPGDSFEALTDLLHRAYALLAAQGIRMWATYQTVDDTRARCASGECWVAEEGGRLVGTITVRMSEPSSLCAWYRRPDVASFGQFGVEPGLQGKGVGRSLLETVERRAREEGRREIACDTSEGAADLISRYQHWGYRLVDRVAWGEVVNYRSVVLSKTLVP